MKRSLEQSIFATLAFYETKGCGRSVKQLYPYLLEYKATQSKVERVLNQLAKTKQILQIHGVYGFTKTSVLQAVASLKLIEKKQLIAQSIARSMSQVPFVTMVGLTQSVVMETATESSDVDIFTVTAPGRLWTARFLALAKLKLSGFVKRKGSIANRGCFGFWVDESALALSQIEIEDDIYLAFWLAHLQPLVNRANAYERLISKNQRLLTRFLNWKRKKSPRNSSERSFLERLLSGKIGDQLESALFVIQAKKIWRDEIAYRKGASVVTSRTMCKLHHFDQRIAIRERWKALIHAKSARTKE